MGENQLTEFLHEVVAKRSVSIADPWRMAVPVAGGYRMERLNTEATERLVQWLIEQQREEDDANV